MFQGREFLLVGDTEGSITTPHDAERIQKVRRASKRLVTIGACATAGGIQALRNTADAPAWVSNIYARPEHIETLDRTVPLFNGIWQGDANRMVLQCLELCRAPARVINLIVAYPPGGPADKAGIKVADKPTWTDIKALAAKIHDPKNGVYGICLRGKPGCTRLC